MVISKTNYRLSLLGGGSDFPSWFMENGGAVLAGTINRACHVSARWLPPFFAHRSRIVWSKIELVKDRAEIEHPAVRAALEMLDIEDGVEIHHDGDLPARSGIGSSSAFAVGLLHALHALRGEFVGPERLAQEAICLECDVLGEPVGHQDQLLCAFGGLRLITWEPGGAWRADPVPLPPEILRAFEERLLLVYTGPRAGATPSPAGHNPAALARLQEMPRWGAECLSDGDWKEFGDLLENAWWEKKSLAPWIVTPEMDDLYLRLKGAGATALKVCGAGGGGFLLVYAEPDRWGKILLTLEGLVSVPVRFSQRGSSIVHYGTEGPL